MASLNIYAILLTFVAWYALFSQSDAQNSPQDYVNTHNVARQLVGVPDVTWNTTLEAYAQDYANQMSGDCDLVHSNGPYGENLFAGSDSSFTGVSAVDGWISERENYDYASNSCVGGECLHYTQVVWGNTDSIGCARVACATGWYFVICSYSPPGNWIGERPY